MLRGAYPGEAKVRVVPVTEVVALPALNGNVLASILPVTSENSPPKVAAADQPFVHSALWTLGARVMGFKTGISLNCLPESAIKKIGARHDVAVRLACEAIYGL